jgi:hypothetical protein
MASGKTWKQFQLVLASLSWVMASSGAILVNQHIMVKLNFPYPATVGSIGLIGTSIICFLVVRVLRLVDARQNMSLTFFMVNVMPTGLFLALAMQLGNTTYLYLSGGALESVKG